MEGGLVRNEKVEDQRIQSFWSPLKRRLNNQLQEDILRIYSESLYCDWVVKFNDKTIQLNKCIIIARAYRFYSFLVSVFESGSSLNRLQIECVCRFLTKIYYSSNIEEEENTVLNELESLGKINIPDSEGFITADSSPTDCKNEFYDAEENIKPDLDTLEQELKEQDHLSHLFQSIKTKSKIPRHVKRAKNPVLQKLNSSDMDSGLETASSETSGMDISLEHEQLSSKERRIVNEHDSSSSETTEDFEDLGKNTKIDLAVTKTKEQKQKQNEEIVIMESSSVSSETGSWESVFPKNSQFKQCGDSSKNANASNENHYFIDASSLHDESEFCPISVAPKSTKLTKVKVNDLSDSQKYEIAEFQKEIKVQQTNHTMDSDFYFVSECASTSANFPSSHSSDDSKPSNEEVCQFQSDKILAQDMECKSPSEDSSSDDVSKNLAEPILKQSQNKYLSDTCDTFTELKQFQNGSVSDTVSSRAETNPNFVQSNTFELDSDDDVSILRRHNERRQGSLIFKSTIPQYSGHVIEETIPVTPHNSIIQLSENIIVDSDRPLDSLFYDKVLKSKDSIPIAEESNDEDIEEVIELEADLKPIKREESVPIISGGVSSSDFKPEIRIDSPLSKRKLESTPIVSGGAIMMSEPKKEVKKPLNSAVTAAWVVDMKPNEQEIEEEKIKTSFQTKEKQKTSLGFFVDLSQITDEVKEESKQTSETENGEADKKNIFSMFIDFEAPKKNMPSRLSQSLYCKKPDKASTSKTADAQMTQSSTNFEHDQITEFKKNDQNIEVRNNGESLKAPSEIKNNGELLNSVTNNNGESSKTKNNGESLKTRNSGESLETRNNGESFEIRNSGESLETKNNGESFNGHSGINSNGESSKLNFETKNGESSKSVYMFIESDTTVVKRRRSSSNNRSHNRHSWNSSGESDTSTLCHQRTYSLSGQESLEFGTRPIIQDKKLIETSSSSDENKDTSSFTENEDHKKMQPITEVKETTSSGFVRLSDLDKPVLKITTTKPEQTVPARMTRSIPETSWIENKLLMSRSTGCRASSSRLFPHLSTSTPSNLFLTHRSKSPGQDTDELVSELSDFSSMHSSTALEVSTEETSHSSSYQPRRSADRLGHDLLRMFLEEISPDVTVEVSGRRLKAHKCILSSRCQYFAAMLSGGWVESAGNVISLQGFSYQAVHFAMCHIYSGAADIPESISLVELATLADMLGLEGLKEVVAYTLKLKHCHLFHKPCSVCVVGVLECLPLAAAYGLDELYRKALRWITRYFVRVWPTRAFAMLPRELMEKCYQQHVVHMSADNVLETTLCCDKLLVTLPSVRWAEIVHELTSQLADSCQHYVTQHFSSVLASASFLSLGKELSWNISRLEDGLYKAAERLQPEQACRSYARAHRLLALLESGEDCWSPNFVELVRKLLAKVEDSVVRQAVRVSYTSAWPRLDASLRSKIQELCCLPLDRPRVSRQPRSTSGSRNLDLRQVRLAMQQHTRRAQSNESRPAARPQKPPPKPVTDPPRPRTWPAQNKKIISSSESSRTSSPAMKRALNKKENKTRNGVNKPVVKEIKESKDDMSLDSLASPINKAKAKTTTSTTKTVIKPKPKIDSSTLTKTESKTPLTQTKKPNTNILKSNIQKTTEKASLSKSLPSMNKENRSLPKQQSKSGSSSSTQHSPSALLRKQATNSSSSPGSQPRTNMSPYNGSPSLRRSLLLAARTPQVPVKPVSPATNKRIARIQSSTSHSITSPTKASAAKCVNTRKSVPQRQVTKPAVKRQSEKTVQRVDKVEKIAEVTVKRSDTFLKDEPTLLNKND